MSTKADNTENTPNEQPEEQASPPPAAELSSQGEDLSPPSAGAEADKLVQKLQEEKRQLADQLLRKQAELENIRKRVQREKEEFLQYSLFNTLQELLPVLDSFELALDSNGGGEDYRKGVELVYQQFRGILQKLGLEAIESRGQEFDPYRHEALVTVETKEYPDQQVIEELQRGYVFKQRLLRPSRVKVAKRPAATPDSPATDGQPE